MTEAIIFDLDDTLLDSKRYTASALESVAERAAREFERPRDKFLELLHQISAKLPCEDPAFFEAFRILADLPTDSVAPLRESFLSHDGDIRLHSDAEEFLERVGSVRLGIVTDGNGVMQRTKVRALGLTRRFRSIVFTSDGGDMWKKPSVLPFRACCSQLRVAPENALYVGDDPHVDAEGPRQLGMRVVRVLRGRYCDDTSRPGMFDQEVESVLDLLESSARIS